MMAGSESLGGSSLMSLQLLLWEETSPLFLLLDQLLKNSPQGVRIPPNGILILHSGP